MDQDMVLRFQDISIGIHTQVEGFAGFIREHTFLKQGRGSSGMDISFLLHGSGMYRTLLGQIPRDARMEARTEVDLDGPVIFRCLTKGDDSIWYILEDYGCIFLDLKTNECHAAMAREGSFQYIDFLLLFLHPLHRLLGGFGYRRIHASCIQVNGRNVLVTGQSGRGKSTAAFALAGRGHLVLTDESPVIFERDECFHACTLLDVIKVRKDALERFFPGCRDILFTRGEDCYLKLSKLNGMPLHTVGPIHDICILSRTGLPETSIEETSPLAVVPELFPQSVDPFLPRQAHGSFEVVMDMLSMARCHLVQFGTDMGLFTQAMERMVET
ncbi:MAG: hypothetical protein R6W96_08280 [Clostridia bacterium]